MSEEIRPYVVYNSAIEEFRILGESLKARYNGVEDDQANTLLATGGDGSVLYALPMAKGRLVYGLVPKSSSSIAYTANVYDPAEDLLKTIAQSEKFPIYPLD